MPMLDGWWGWSGEADLGFWGALRTASVNVVNDDVVGLYGSGGDVSLSSGSYQVVPKDGVRQRLAFYNEGGFQIGLEQAKYTQATVADDLKRISLTVERVADGAHSPTVTLRSCPPERTTYRWTG